MRTGPLPVGAVPGCRFKVERSEFVCIQCNETDVDALQACMGERFGQSFEQGGVGGQAEVGDARGGGDCAHERQDFGIMVAQSATINEWFAAGEPDFANAEAGGGVQDAQDFVGEEGFSARQPGDAVAGHAVGAAQVTAVGE